MTDLLFKFQFITQNRCAPDTVSSGAGADRIAHRTETHWQRALPAKHQFITLPGALIARIACGSEGVRHGSEIALAAIGAGAAAGGGVRVSIRF